MSDLRNLLVFWEQSVVGSGKVDLVQFNIISVPDGLSMLYF